MSILYRLLNPAMNALLESPLHGIISWRIMTVGYSGRKTGRHFSTPVSYYREKDTVYCFTNGKWRNNFIEPRSVTLLIKRKTHNAIAVASPAGREENIAIMARYFKAVPADAKFYGVTFNKKGEPNIATVRAAASFMTMIRFELE